jgi:hypothetical protein
VRIYLPATLDEIDPASPGLGPRRVHAVTPALRAALPDEDEEGLEFAAHLAAADASLELLAQRPGAPRLRLVVSADVPDGVLAAVDDPAEGPSALELLGPVEGAHVACVHVDEPAAAPDVVRAVAGDETAVERLDDADLLWYDVSELAAIPRP